MRIKNIFVIFLIIFFLLFSFIFLFYIFTPTPTLDSIQNIKSERSIKLFDRNDVFLYDLSKNTNTKWVDIKNINENIKNTTVSVEDEDFYNHKGIQITAFLRALFVNIKTKSFSQGGSTITQQVIKNLLLTGDKKIIRKLKEFLLAPQLERKYSKDKILEIYLNTSSFGGKIVGIGPATEFFYGKTPSQLTLAESAYLSALLKAPSYYSPYGKNKNKLDNRKNFILEKLLINNKITKEEYIASKKESVFFRKKYNYSIKAPHFVFHVEDFLKKRYGDVFSTLAGAKIKTTLDYRLQKYIEDLLKTNAKKIQETHNLENMASVVIENKTGDILSMVGSRDFFDNEINGEFNVITSKRQPGSSFKPFVYASSFEKGFLPETVIFDVETQFSPYCEKDFFETSDECYSPVNYNRDFSGPISFRKALAQSLNVPAVKVLYLTGMKNFFDLIKKLNLINKNEKYINYGLSVALGAISVSPLDLATAYSVFPNQGVFVKNKSVEYIEVGGTKNQIKNRIETNVLKKDTANTINDILSDDKSRYPSFPLNSYLTSDKRVLAVKTGTADNRKDIWIVGYTPKITVLVWAGNNNNDGSETNVSGFYLSPVWNKIIEKASSLYQHENDLFNSFNLETPSLSPVIFGGWDQEIPPHTILHYIDKNNLNKKIETIKDIQYPSWEFGVMEWWEKNKNTFNIPKYTQTNDDDFFVFLSPEKNKVYKNKLVLSFLYLKKKNVVYEIYINGIFVNYSTSQKTNINLNKIKNIRKGRNNISVVFYEKTKKTFSTYFNYFEEQQ